MPFQPLVETKPCPECGAKAYHNKGISKKNGRPYENWKCGKCDYIEWVEQKTSPIKSIQPTQSTQPKETINGALILADEIKALRDVINDLGARIDTLINKINKEIGE